MSKPFGTAALALDLQLQVVARQPNGLKVVLFAGGGGSCTGIEAGLVKLGDPSPYIDVAINHDEFAVAMHRANHPRTRHYCNNVWKVRPQQIIDDHAGRPIDMLWASPDCTDHSKAKGGKPVRKHIRDLAWIVLAYAKLPKHLRPQVIYFENVEEFRDWSPERQRKWPNGKPMFDLHGAPVMERDPTQKGKTFKKWVREHRRLGYRVEFREIRASAKGAPTIRKRLYGVMRCDRRPIVWRDDTHGTEPGQLPMRTAAECIDFSLPCPSIFLTKAQAKRQGLRVIRPLADATERRIARGIDRFVLRTPKPFLVPLTHTGDSRVYDIDEGLRTQTCASRGEQALVEPFFGTYYGDAEGRQPRVGDIHEGLRTQGVENRHSLVAPMVVRTAHGEQDRNGKKRGKGEHSVEATLPTQTGSNDFAVVNPVIVGVGSRAAQSAPRPVTKPHATTTATKRGQHALVAPVVTNYKGNSIGSPVTVGVPTVTANSFEKRPGGCAPLAVTSPVLVGRHSAHGNDVRAAAVTSQVNTLTGSGGPAVVAPYFVPRYGERPATETSPAQEPRCSSVEQPGPVVVPTGNGSSLVTPVLVKNMTNNAARSPEEPLSTSLTGNHHIVTAASLVRQFGNSGDAKADEPAPVVMPGGGGKTGVVAAHLAQNNTGMTGHDTRKPISTIVEKGSTQSVVASHLINLKGSDRRFAEVDAPAPTQCSQGTHIAQVYAFMVKYHGGGGQLADLKEPLRTADTEDRMGVVTCEAIPEPQLTEEQRKGALRCVRFLQKHGVLPKDSRAVMVLVCGMPMVDIGLRMLKARELYNAQGFPLSYIIDRGLFLTPSGALEWRALTVTVQVKCCGNSVCPPVAEDLVLGNHHVNDNVAITAEAV